MYLGHVAFRFPCKCMHMYLIPRSCMQYRSRSVLTAAFPYTQRTHCKRMEALLIEDVECTWTYADIILHLTMGACTSIRMAPRGRLDEIRRSSCVPETCVRMIYTEANSNSGVLWMAYLANQGWNCAVERSKSLLLMCPY